MWIGSDNKPHRGNLWAWGVWEPESRLIRKLDPPCGNRDYPRFLWHPYYVPRTSYRGLHNTDPFIFGDCFLYSNCHQPGFSGLKRLATGSVIAFGSCKMGVAGEWRRWIDTVFVVPNSISYPVSRADQAFNVQTSDAFSIVTGRPLTHNYEAGCGADARFRLYRGATPDDPVDGVFSFFPAKLADGEAGFPRPVINLPREYFNPRLCMNIKGVSRKRSRDQLHWIWSALVAQVRQAGLVLGTYAEMPRPRVHMGASNELNTGGDRLQGTTDC